MGDIINKLITHGEVLENIDLDSLTKEARKAHLPTVNTKTYMYDAMEQSTSSATKVGSISATLTQLVTTGARGRLYSMHHSLNMGYQNIGLLKQNLTGLCNVFGTLDQKCIICIIMVQLS